MYKEDLEIKVALNNHKKIELKIRSLADNSLFLIDEVDALQNGESPYQIKEGHFYDFKIEQDYYLKDDHNIVNSNKFNNSIGRISPNIYVGTLALDVFHKNEREKCGIVKIEVRSTKTTYRNDYRKMLGEITDQCIDLIFQHSSPVTQTVTVNFSEDNKTPYQRFAFIKAILDTGELFEACHKVISNPVKKWSEFEIDKDIRGVKRINNKSLRQIASISNRLNLPELHPLKVNLNSIPSKIKINQKKESIDTAENRFVKYALNSFLTFINDIREKVATGGKTYIEASILSENLEQLLSHSLFKEISQPTNLTLNSPILQRKEGYREILRIWLMFHLAAQLTWAGGDDIYDIGKRDVAVLYEYWLFFKLLRIVESVFGIKPSKNLIVDTNDNLGLQLKRGKWFPIEGVCDKYHRKLEIQFSYNRTFTGSKNEITYPKAGSWTKSMRPDYTLSIWPYGIQQDQAEKEELIVHIHFDAKYRVNKLTEIFGDEIDKFETENENQDLLNIEKEDERKGNFKRADLLKMHSYKDAIRRTGGAYILYPGVNNEKYTKKGFHELLPGLGAFAINPSTAGINDSTELKLFFEDVVHHFLNRASQREKIAFRTYDIHKNKDIGEVREMLPEAYGENRSLIPDETYVLVGYYKSPQHLEWISSKGIYNFRAGNGKGALKLTKEVVSAKFLLLHTSKDKASDKLFQIIQSPIYYTANDLELSSYPSKPTQKGYFVVEVKKADMSQFNNSHWNFEALGDFKSTVKSGYPLVVSLTELMKVSVK